MILILSGLGVIPPATPQDDLQVRSAENAPWWPADVTQPDQFREGWNLRIPLVVHDDRDRQVVGRSVDLPAGTPVQVHLDLAQSLIEGGWPASGNTPRSFMSYPESIRLIEYTQNWEEIRPDMNEQGIPIRVWDTWLDPDQRGSLYEKQQTGPFHGQRNAVATLEWRLPRDLPAGETHHYFAYFDIQQNAGEDREHEKQEPEYSRTETESLNGLYWLGTGTTIYGFTNEATTSNTLMVVATEDDTTVTVDTYRGRTSNPGLDVRDGVQNPFTIETAGDPASYSFGLQTTNFRITADKPVIVMTHRLGGTGATHLGEFVPSLEGSTLGWNFIVPEVARGVYVIKPPGGDAAQIQITEAETTTTGNCNTLFHSSQSRFCRVAFMTTGQPERTRNINVVGDPVLVQFIPASTSTAHPSQAASSLGSPVGTVFHAATLGEQCNQGNQPTGGYQATAWQRSAFVDVRDRTQSSGLIFHDNVEIQPAPRQPLYDRLGGGPMPVQSCPASTPPQPQWDTPRPFTVEAVSDPETNEPTGAIQVRAGSFGGGAVSQTTPFGGRHAMEFHIEGPFVVFNNYETTRIQVLHPNGQSEDRILGQLGTLREYDVGRNEATTLVADKPVSVFPLGSTSNFARFHAAKPDFLEPQILPGQYRGYLFQVEPTDGVDPVFITGLPGDVIDVGFQTRNLALWNNEPLVDTISFSSQVDSRNWDGFTNVRTAFESREMTFTDDAARNNRIAIDLPDDIPSDTQITVRVHAASDGNPLMKQDFSITILVRQTFDVEMWFGEPTSVSGPRELPMRFEEGQQRVVPFVVRNDGSGTDDFDLSFGAPGGGWSARVTDPAGVPMDRIEQLEPGEQTGGLLIVQAPSTIELTAVSIPVDAVSRTSPLASDRIILSASLALAQDIELQADRLSHSIAPGSTERFTVRLINTGDDGLSIRLGVDAHLPPGWAIRFAGLGAPDRPPISMQPGDEVQVPIDVTAAMDAAANEFVSFLLRAEGQGEGVEARDAISLSATVDRSHMFEIRPLDRLSLRPGDPTAFELEVTNTGNTKDEVRIEPAVIPGGWNITALNGTKAIEPDETIRLGVEITVPPQTPPGPADLLLQARSGGPAFGFPVGVEVQAVNELDWASPSPVVAQPGESTAASLRLENHGNVPQRVTLQALVDLWDVHLPKTSVEVPPGTFRMVRVEWDVPQGEPEDTQHLRVQARTESGLTKEVEIPVRVESPTLELSGLVLTSAPRGPGSVGTVVATLHNPGGVPVKNVEARLVASGQEGEDGVGFVDRVEFSSIGPNGTVVAPLRWVEGEDERPQRFVWGSTIDETFHEMGSADMPEESTRGLEQEDAPTVLPVMLLLVLAVALWIERTRRRRLGRGGGCL